MFGMENLEEWYSSPLGRMIMDHERQMISHVVSQKPATVAVQIHGPQVVNYIADSPARFKLRFDIADEFTIKTDVIKTHAESLPLLPHSVDTIVLAHALEHCQKPESLLLECSEALAQGGMMIILAFNPWSLWGLTHIVKHYGYPWNQRFWAPGRVSRCLTDLGLDNRSLVSFFFRPPFNDMGKLQNSVYWEALGRMVWPDWGGIYCLVLKKTTVGMTPLNLRNKYQTCSAANASESTIRARINE